MRNDETEFAAIDAMTHEDMARLWRYAPAGHPYFDRTLPYFERFEARFDAFGGFNPTLSKKISP